MAIESCEEGRLNAIRRRVKADWATTIPLMRDQDQELKIFEF